MQQDKKRSMRKYAYMSMMIFCAVILLSACGGKQNAEPEAPGQAQAIMDIPDDMIVAEYEGGEVTGAELKAYRGVTRLFVGPTYDQLESLDPKIHETLIARIVAFETLQERADDQMRQEESERAKRDLDELKNYISQQSGQEITLDQMLDEAGITEEQLMDYLVQSNIVHAVMAEDIDEESVKSEYDRLAAENYFDLASVRHILIRFTNDAGEEIRTKEEARERAEEIIQMIKDGRPMEELAEEFSEDPGSKNNGGLYENANVNMWVPEFREAAITLPLKEVSEPVETAYGFHVIRVEERETLSYEEVSSDIRKNLVQQEIADYVGQTVPDLIRAIHLPSPQS